MSSLLEFVVEVCVLCDMDSDCGGYPHSMDFVDTQKACISVDHIDEKIWGPLLVDADWHAFCQAIYEGIGRSEWEELNFHYRDMSKAAGAKKTK